MASDIDVDIYIYITPGASQTPRNANGSGIKEGTYIPVFLYTQSDPHPWLGESSVSVALTWSSGSFGWENSGKTMTQWHDGGVYLMAYGLV